MAENDFNFLMFFTHFCLLAGIWISYICGESSGQLAAEKRIKKSMSKNCKINEDHSWTKWLYFQKNRSIDHPDWSPFNEKIKKRRRECLACGEQVIEEVKDA